MRIDVTIEDGIFKEGKPYKNYILLNRNNTRVAEINCDSYSEAIQYFREKAYYKDQYTIVTSDDTPEYLRIHLGKHYRIMNDFDMSQWVDGEQVNGLKNDVRYCRVEAADEYDNLYTGYCPQIHSEDEVDEPGDMVDWDNAVVLETSFSAARKRLGMTQKDVALLLDIPLQTWEKWERGERLNIPNYVKGFVLERLAQWCEAL